MKIGTYTLAAMLAIEDHSISPGKTTVQKLVYFALPADKRRAFYKPYYYGPFSEAVQDAFGSLQQNGFISYSQKSFKIMNGRKHIEKTRDDQVVRRLNKTAAFLEENGLKSTKSISILSKVHLLRQGKSLSGQELHDFIRSRGQYFGWKELSLSELSDQELDKYLELAGRLEKTLSSI
jgi:uncharacterized protein YwgA